jgi:hypothetical protein
MKHRAETGLAVCASVICMAATAMAQTGMGKVEINNDYVVVHPGTKLSTDDAQSLDDVLKTYDKSLYKIEVYNQGQTTSSLGTLRDMCVDRRAMVELAFVKTQGQSERAIQLIAPSSPQTGQTLGGSQTATPTPPRTSPVNPQMIPVNPQQSPVNPQMNAMNDTATPSGTGAPTSPQAAVNPTTSTQPCGSTDPKAAEFLQRVKAILEKYSR